MTIGSYLSGTGMEFSKSVPVIMITVLAEWLCFVLVMQNIYREKTDRGRGLVMSLILLGMNTLLQIQFYPIALHCMLQIICWTVYLCAACRIRWHNAVFSSSVFCLALELGKSLFRGGTLAYVISSRFPEISIQRVSVITFVCFLVYLGLMVLMFRKLPRTLTGVDFEAPQVAGLLFPLVLYLFIRQFQSGLDPSMPALLYYSLDIISTAVAVCALIVIEITTRMLRTQTSRNELLQKQLLAQERFSQYQIQKEALDAVNRKYHDLKHYLSAAEASIDSEELRQFAREMRSEIRPVETIQKTGNETMDILLSQRITQCQEKEIRFIPYIDGRKLDTLSTIDLCTLFGNAMDNAVEESEKIAEKEKREISVKIENYGTMIVFRVVNCCSSQASAFSADGLLPPTSKADKASHGFGLASIRTIAEKYGGSMTAACENGWFELLVLIPSAA